MCLHLKHVTHHTHMHTHLIKKQQQTTTNEQRGTSQN